MPYKDPEVRRLKQREASRRYYKKNREKLIKATAEWKKANAEHVRAYKKKYKREHPEYRKRRWKAYYANQREHRRKTRKEHYARNKEHTLRICKKYRDTHKDQRKEYMKGKTVQERTRLREFYRKKKRLVIEAYGGKCECCSESRFEFLTIDHIGGGGRKDRAKRGGSAFYAVLQKRGFPKEGYRLLCMNCNFALGIYGHCPHQTLGAAK